LVSLRDICTFETYILAVLSHSKPKKTHSCGF